MRVEAGVSGCAGQGFVVFEGDVASCLGIFVTLGKPKVYYVNHMLVLSWPDQEVVWLDIPMQESILMNELYSL